ncbi:MAG: folate family ECF transporter S component [Faecalibacterium sp.]|nr:folate family ECF transporter S component [Ruminococcus sp.]MCM1393095.1 folate family ECF transporter S component [Ruminococcus sp.]MCM1486001.1 folate family ECF transporter S component [Faecalibacterium sp.]
MKKSKKAPMEVIFDLVCTALLIALQVILSRLLSIQMWNLKIGLSFIPVVIAARLFGPIGSMAVYGIGDLIGALAFATAPYFPGYTVTALLSGLIYGLFLWKKSNPWRVIISVVLNQFICSFLLNSFWISFTSGSPYVSQLAIRWPQSLGIGIVQIILMIVALERICNPIENQIIKKMRK